MKTRTISNAYQIPPAGQWRKLISRIQRTYKMAKLFNQIFFGMTLFHAHAQYIYIVNAKYQKPSVKALVQVDFPVYAQAKSLFKSKQEKKWLISKSCYFVKKCFLTSNFFMQMFNVSILCRQILNCFGTSCGTSWIPCICTIYTHVIQNC